MVLSASPRKAVPLASGDGCEPSKVASITRRAFFCGVVVESEGGNAISEDVQELVASLGDPLSSQPDNDTVQSSSLERDGDDDANVEINRNMKSSSSAIEDILNEFVATERSYVKRLRTLKHDYADPLRTFARSKDTAIISLYDANTLFGNIDNLLPVNEALLADLDKMVSPEGPQTVGFIGDVVLRHFKDFHGFEQYKQYYVKREEAQSIFEREMSRKSSGFAAFVDRIKYSSADTMNRIGLRELLMDPVQRIPRYTMMLHAMIKRMPSGDPQRAKLVEAVEIASKIAQAEVDEETRRASVMFCLRTTIDGFPPGLISHSRRLVDYIDVGDAFTEGLPSAPSGTGNSVLEPLHCTLFLFDDKLMIAKRPGNGEKSGQVLTGLDQLEKIAKGSGVPSGLKKSGMSCKGVVDLTDVVATDVGGADFHLYLEKPPQDQTDRWSGRPFRPLSVVFPPYPPNLNPQRTENEKVRFLENLWLSQANIRARSGKSIVLHSDEREVESRGGRTTYARTYFNVYQRTAFLQEPRKTKVVVHIDELGTSDPIPFGVNGPPFVSIRVQPMAGALSRYKVTSSDPNDENEEDIVQTGRVSDRVVHTIHQYGLFKFRTGKNSVPSTPTATSRSRATIFGLDAISRNLFNAFPVTVRGDIFGGSINGSRRSKSSTSRSSVSAQSSSDGSFTRFSQRSSSTLTAATSISSMDDETLDGTRPSRQKSRTRRLLGRSRSPKGSGSEPDVSPKRRTSRSGSVSSSFSREQSPAIDQVYDAHEMAPEKRDMDESEWDLTMRLELARHNSQNQRSKGPTEPPWDGPVEDTIYEDKISVPESLRPSSPASRSVFSQRSTTPTNLLFLPSPTEVNEPPESAARKVSGSRPRGPRSPSPLPPSPRASPEPDFESLDSALETTLHNLNPPPVTPPKSVSPLPRSRRQPFEPTGNTEATPISISHSVQNTPTTIEPLSIKKKISLRSSTGESPPNRKAQTRTPPNIRGRIVSPRRVSPIVRQKKTAAFSGSRQDIGLPRLLRLVESIKTELETSRRAVKRIKLDSEQLPWTQISDVDDHVPRLHKIGGLHPTPQRNSVAMNKAAQERMDEMRQLIRKRVGEVTPRSQCRGQKEVVSADSDMCRTGDLLISIEDALSEADKSLVRAASNQEALSVDIGLLATDLKEKASLIEKSRVELQSTKRQCELVKSLLADATAENEIMYEAFNEELDGMFNDAHLPETDAWAAMTRDLRQSKESRNALSKENSQLKRRLAESESEKEEWGALLRRHGLIS